MKYGDEKLAQEIVDAKNNDPKVRETQTKDHPDCPGNEVPKLELIGYVHCSVCVANLGPSKS